LWAPFLQERRFLHTKDESRPETVVRELSKENQIITSDNICHIKSEGVAADSVW
jgi:hypothetical protein